MLKNGAIMAWKLCAVLLLCVVVYYAFGASTQSMSETIVQEQAANARVIGNKEAHKATHRAKGWFDAAFKNTGIMRGSYRLVNGATPAKSSGIKTLEGKGNKVLHWISGRLKIVWMMVFQAFLRVSITLVWWPYALAVCVPFVVDALVVRKIKSANFGITSPHKFYIAWVVVTGLPWFYLLMVFAPFRYPPMMTPILMLVFAGAGWVTMGEFAKRA